MSDVRTPCWGSHFLPRLYAELPARWEYGHAVAFDLWLAGTAACSGIRWPASLLRDGAGMWPDRATDRMSKGHFPPRSSAWREES